MTKRINLGPQQRSAQTGSFGVPKPVTTPGQMPFPAGAIIREFKPTPSEEAVLRQYNWEPGDPAPENLADILHDHAQREGKTVQDFIAAQRSAAIKAVHENLPLPVPANTPPLVMPKEKSIDSLTPDAQQEILQAMRMAKQADADAQRIRKSMLEAAGPGINDAIAKANEAPPVVDDRKEDVYVGTQQPKRSLTGAVVENHRCKHCGRDQEAPSASEPQEEDKFVFVQSVLGGRPFSKTVRALGNQLLITTRSLSVSEVDLCHKQVYIEKGLGEVVTPFDVTETVMRYRLCLQLVKVQGNGIEFDLPESIEDWKAALADLGIEIEKGHTPLRAIKEWMDANIFKTETMIRMVSVSVADLNRLLANLEANYLNSDFWTGTVA